MYLTFQQNYKDLTFHNEVKCLFQRNKSSVQSALLNRVLILSIVIRNNSVTLQTQEKYTLSLTYIKIHLFTKNKIKTAGHTIVALP